MPSGQETGLAYSITAPAPTRANFSAIVKPLILQNIILNIITVTHICQNFFYDKITLLI